MTGLAQVVSQILVLLFEQSQYQQIYLGFLSHYHACLIASFPDDYQHQFFRSHLLPSIGTSLRLHLRRIEATVLLVFVLHRNFVAGNWSYLVATKEYF